MKPIGIVGILLIIVGAIVVAMGGLSYLKDRDTARIGPIKVTAEERGFITPLAGLAAVGVGVVLLTVGGKRARA